MPARGEVPGREPEATAEGAELALATPEGVELVRVEAGAGPNARHVAGGLLEELGGLEQGLVGARQLGPSALKRLERSAGLGQGVSQALVVRVALVVAFEVSRQGGQGRGLIRLRLQSIDPGDQLLELARLRRQRGESVSLTLLLAPVLAKGQLLTRQAIVGSGPGQELFAFAGVALDHVAGPSDRVQELALGVGLHQALGLALTEELAQAPGPRAVGRKGKDGVVERAPAAACGAERPLEDLLALRTLEHHADLGLRSAGSHPAGSSGLPVRALSEDEAERVQEERLALSRTTGEDVQAFA